MIGGWLEDIGIEVAFSMAAVVIAQIFIAAPFYVRAAALGFGGIDLEIEQAAQLDGASRWQIFRYVILPLSRFALLSGGMMCWARALGEFGRPSSSPNLPGGRTIPIARLPGVRKRFEARSPYRSSGRNLLLFSSVIKSGLP
jgi:molybdate transport system permease protein